MIRAVRTMLVLAAVGLFVGLGVSGVVAQAAGPCGNAGQGDRDHDGLSNCMERRVYGTSPRDYDTDHDGIPDPDEIENGTDPTNPDTDGDGISDGDEGDRGSDPAKADTDDDGIPDGEDCDPGDDLGSAIKGDATEVTCPTADVAGSLKVLGIPITLTMDTELEHVESCAGLAEKVMAQGEVHVKVKVSGDLSTEIVAHEVELDDVDHDGCPNGVDDDDDNDDSPDDPGSDGGDGGGGDGGMGGDGEGGGDGGSV